MFKQLFISIAILLAGSQYGFSQDEFFRTDEGTIVITGVIDDANLSVYSKHLIILLNYETAEIMMQLDKSTLRTRVDSLDIQLEKMKNDYIRFNGKMDIEYINTKGHPPQNFGIEGDLKIRGQERMINGKGYLEHLIEGTEQACFLKMTFYLSKQELGIALGLPGLYDKFYVEILYTVLKREND